MWRDVCFECAEGEYVSEALLVPDRCRFLHKEQMDICESYVYWHNIAKEVRKIRGRDCFCYIRIGKKIFCHVLNITFKMWFVLVFGLCVSQACTADNLELHSYGMLLPCGDNYRGVEYVCCPSRSTSSNKMETEAVDGHALPEIITSQSGGKVNPGWLL